MQGVYPVSEPISDRIGIFFLMYIGKYCWFEKNIEFTNGNVDVIICADCFNASNRCFVNIMKAYGRNNFDFPDPRCALAPEFLNTITHG